MKVFHFVVLACLVVTLVQAGQPVAKDHPEYEVVKAVIEDSIAWALDKDTERLFQIFANDDDLLIWWVSTGGSAEGIGDLRKLAETVWMTPDFEATRFELRDLRIGFSTDASMAWFSCHLDDCGIWKGREFCAENVRNTGVLEKRGDQWTIVQYHGSWPVDEIPDATWQRLLQARQQREAGE